MKLMVYISLAIGLMSVGSSKEVTVSEDANPPPGSGEDGTTGDVAPAPKNEATEKLSDPNAVPVLADRDGKFYQVYEIAKIPYTGKVVFVPSRR